MAYQSIWYFTNLPKEIVNIIDVDLSQRYDKDMKDSLLHGDTFNKDKRNSQNTWIPTTHWLSGFIWHYVQKANRENFLYDLSHIDGDNMQYTRYGEGQFYNWHNDSSLPTHYKPAVSNIDAESSKDNDELHKDFLNKNCEYVRKLSFAMQLSDPDDYEGGNVQLMDESGDKYVVPRERGSIVLFDSRTQHRVCKVTSGVRKSIVGWVIGPRWK